MATQSSPLVADTGEAGATSPAFAKPCTASAALFAATATRHSG
jgi:hypothetical protein